MKSLSRREGRPGWLICWSKAPGIEGDFKARIAQIGPGQISGEMAFLENDVASATVTAEEELKAYALEWSALKDLFELFPHLASRFYRSLAVTLARRLRDQIID